MFLIPIIWRFVLIAVCFIAGIGLNVAYGFWYGFPFYLFGIFLAVGYVLMGTLQSAAMKLQEGDYKGAEKQLAYTYFPKALLKPFRSNFYMLKSAIAMQNKDTATANKYMALAEQTGFQSDDERAISYLQQAGTAVNTGNWVKAQTMLKNLKSLDVKEDMVKQQIKQVELAIRNKGNYTAANRAQAAKMGSKRRRPPQR
ncbi:MAG: hypothetical protein IPO14_02620 [Saprospiraceae bacterium]|jgi:hypothetical protein|nr:hypothetical protein [Saprospiraceae bacterium]